MERDTLHLSMTDAMGHTVEAAVLATVLVGALRNARRAGADLAEQARLANAGLEAYVGERRLRHRAARARGPAQRARRPSSTPAIRRRCGCATA